MKNNRIYIIGGLVLAIIIIIVIALRGRKGKKAEIKAIHHIIDNNLNLTGEPDEGLRGAIDPSKADDITWTSADIARAKELAEQINDALGYWTPDDPEEVYDAIKRSRNKRFFALVAKTFIEEHGVTLQTFFSRHLSGAEKGIALDEIEKLPE